MKRLKTVIGDHVIRISTPSERIREWLSASFRLESGEEADLAASDADLDVGIIDGYGRPFHNYELEESGADESYYRWERGDYRISATRDYRFARVMVHDDFSLKHALLHLYSGLITHRQWGVLMNSCSLVEDQFAYIFAARSQSDYTCLLEREGTDRLLSDKATLIKVGSPSILVYDSPFRSRYASRNTGLACRLAAITVLQESQRELKAPMRRADALLHLLDRLYYWPNDPGELRKLLRMCRRLAESVTVYQHFTRKVRA